MLIILQILCYNNIVSMTEKNLMMTMMIMIFNKHTIPNNNNYKNIINYNNYINNKIKDVELI